MLVQEILHKNAITLTETQSIREALMIMNTHKLTSLVVVDDKQKVKGILNLQDILDAIVPAQMKENVYLAKALHKPNYFEEQTKELGDMCVACVMRTNFPTTSANAQMMDIASELLHNDIDIIPVVEEEKLIGLITHNEVKQALANIMNISA